MKSLFYTILVFALAFLAYDYFLAPAGQKIVFKSLNRAPAAAPEAAAPAAEPRAPAKPAIPERAVAPPAPVPSAPRAAATAAVATAPAFDADGFPLPKFDPIEVLTKSWTFIPASAFPRPVKLTKDTEFKLSVGASRMGAGGQVVALGMQDGLLTIAPTETSPARARVGLDDTNLKSVLSDGYEQWKVLRTATLKKAWQRKKSTVAQGSSAGVTLAGAVDGRGIPVKSGGSYPLLLASIQAGQVTDIQPDKVRMWGDPVQKTIDGQTYWTVPVRYDTNTIFGPMEAEAEARVQAGKVVGWFFTGSGEEVP